ncbi:36164_t:CDS:1, partial [Racocetra persica]
FISKELSKRNMQELSKINNAQKTYSEKSSEINNIQETYSEENNEDALFDYQQGIEQLFSFPLEYNIFGLDISNQHPLTGFDGWQLTEKLENPS